MPDIAVGNQVFDVAFHPSDDVVLAGLLTGQVTATKYNPDGEHTPLWDIRPTKRSCRGLAFSYDGARIYSVSKDRAIHVLDPNLGTVLEAKLAAHESPINRVALAMPNMLATGDDDGIIKLWDTRNLSEIREYKQHFDFISDFLWLEDKKHLVATSGDGTLSVMDVRASKTEPFAQSEDQEDELLSIVPIKGGQKVVVGTQLGILSIFNRKSGWGDCVDRVPGHPQSIDALVELTADVILTGSSDGLVRAVQILPSKLLGAVADHGEFPIERLALDRNKHWLASASHDDVVKLTDVKDILEDSDDENEEGEGQSEGGSVEDEDDSDSDAPPATEAQRSGKRKKKNKEKPGEAKRSNSGTKAAKDFFSEL
ncbi:WD40 repeat-like protein [Auriculariales sp. MPI-PUGE-AT-0066]|nr:WD40 repeat-like protein [Auriculariales sp. MPI-PUGE-AT-0066]